MPGWGDHPLGERANKRCMIRISYRSCEEGLGKLEGVVHGSKGWVEWYAYDGPAMSEIM